ncbi:transglutaminaseTgpA domain-containing protein [Alkalicoccus chagannorensis]|uniref:transglutaminaseTgpA domain-containing protein n=1 Tax=Alkalicoccus chagannorensis TaxID=427072 RepID=UPI000415C7DD|nr:transglutaminaseTgpA domain-containing protein [Alkalicoccus chagannorensis]
MEKGQTPKKTVTHFFIYALTMLLLWEWLRPVPVITATGSIEVFVIFMFAAAVLVYFRPPAWAAVPIAGAGMLYGLHRIFGEGRFIADRGGGSTFRAFLTDFQQNAAMILSGNFADLTDFFRTFLLFLLLALLAYLMYFWVLHTRKVFFFLAATLIYITVLDTFTLVDASQAVVRIVVIGFFILALLHMLRVQEEERRIGRRRGTFISPAWMYTLIGVVTTAVAAGLFLPKPDDPQWNDPVPAMRTIVGSEALPGSGGGGTVRRVGYGENDDQLGGGFVQNEAPVFEAVTDRETYWRGESKDVYTGSGWQSDPEYIESDMVYGSGIDYRLFSETQEVESSSAEITMDEEADFDLAFYPGQPLDITDIQAEADDAALDEGEVQFYTDVIGGRLQAETMAGEDLRLDSYVTSYEDPVFDVNALRETGDNDPEEVTDRYLQLPDDLPERVGDLAEEITAEHDNRYDIAEAVEQYFNQNDFEYSTTDVPIPGDDEDYVDQFLFETQVGYCDNYSTAMAVMLRSLDIPTRWVKGFTSGEEVEELEDGRSVYEVRNGNAHSWVEVYFPDVGWVPFEPTQGFTNYAEFEEESPDIDVDVDGEEPDMEEPDMPDTPDSSDDLLEEGTDEEGTGGAADEEEEGSAGLFSMRGMLTALPILFLTAIAYSRQSFLQNQFFLIRYKMFGRDISFPAAYERLLWILRNEGLPRAEGETLREYARRVDLALSSQAMMKLTKAYEQVYYGGRPPQGEWEARSHDWEEIVKALNA